jgi:hypothetical protein
MTPDPFRGSALAADPKSWNRFSYVLNDPANGWDPRGLDTCGRGEGGDDGDGGDPDDPDPESACNGGGPKGGTGFDKAAMQTQARNAVMNLSKSCQQALSNSKISLGQLTQTAGVENFISAVVSGSQTINSLVPGAVEDPNETVQQFVGNNFANIAYPNGNILPLVGVIVLGSSFLIVLSLPA